MSAAGRPVSRRGPVRRGEAWAAAYPRPGLPEGPTCRRADVGLSRGYRHRRAAWLVLTSRTVWDFDRPEAFDAAVLVLTRGSREKIDGYLAAGSILDVWDGRPPTSRVPDTWRELPDQVLTVLRLTPGEPSPWFDDRAVKPADEALRDASILAALSEAAGDDHARALFDDVVRLRSRPPAPPAPSDVVPLVELPGLIRRMVDLERERDEATDQLRNLKHARAKR